MPPIGYSRVSVTEQPHPELSMNLSNASTEKFAEKGLAHHHTTVDGSQAHSCEQCQPGTGDDDHRHCHNGRLRRFIMPIVVAFVLLGCLMALGCMLGQGSGWGIEDIISRAVNDTTNGNENTFVHNKLYLIVIFVGLFVVLILAIMLSAWCCKGAFQNPCCCPCYLCACCGGLACLECIGCGLCAEGMDQM